MNKAQAAEDLQQKRTDGRAASVGWSLSGLQLLLGSR